MLTLDEIPDKRARRYPTQKSVKLTKESEALLERLKKMGKDPTDFMRIAIERALLSVFPEERENLCQGAAKAS